MQLENRQLKKKNMVTGLWELKKTINSKHKSWKSQLRVESESECEVAQSYPTLRYVDFATPWTVAHRTLPSMGFSGQEYWSGLPFPSPGLIIFETLHLDVYIFPLILCLFLLFFSQLFLSPLQTTILPFCISFSWGWFHFLGLIEYSYGMATGFPQSNWCQKETR